MCEIVSIILGSIGTALASTAGVGVTAGTVGGAAIAGTAAGAAGISISAGAAVGIGAGAVALTAGAGAALGLGLSKKPSTGGLSIDTDALRQKPTSLADTVSKSASTVAENNKQTNTLSSLRIKQNPQQANINTASDSGVGLNLGG